MCVLECVCVCVSVSVCVCRGSILYTIVLECVRERESVCVCVLECIRQCVCVSWNGVEERGCELRVEEPGRGTGLRVEV